MTLDGVAGWVNLISKLLHKSVLPRIIINSLSAHVHVCSKLTKCEPGMVSSLGHNLRSQEMSENSIGFLGTVTLQVRFK